MNERGKGGVLGEGRGGRGGGELSSEERLEDANGAIQTGQAALNNQGNWAIPRKAMNELASMQIDCMHVQHLFKYNIYIFEKY